VNRALYLALAIAAAACSSPAPAAPVVEGSAASEPAVPAPTVPAAPPASTHTTLEAMASLVGHVGDPAKLADWARKIDAGEAKLEGYIDELLVGERFGREVMPTLLFGAFVSVRSYYSLPIAFVLKHDDDAAPLYLRAACSASEAVKVNPWWNLKSEILVCPEAYRPEKWTMTADEHSYRTRTVLTCDSLVGSPELEQSPLCGCGPNLIRCLRDEAQYNEFIVSFMEEVKRTTEYVVRNDLPIATLFTGNSTFRDRNVELYYRRQKIGALATKRPKRELRDLGTWSAAPTGYDDPIPPDLGSWPAEGKWAPRPEAKPGQHAGVLTAPQILHWLPDRRQRQRAYYEIMWCNLRNSFGATTQKVLELNTTGNNFFAHDSWKQLAHTDLCTNCHARLDYGFQFFHGYPDSRASTHYNPALQLAGSGPLYGRDIEDLRGNAPLTPIGFAKLATEQTDFKSCMASQFVNYVLGERATADDVQAIEAAVTEKKTFKAAMKVALVRYAKALRQPATPAAAAVVVEPSAGGGLTVGPTLRKKLEDHCVDCHDGSQQDLDFRGELTRSTLVRMTDQAAFGMMPKDHPLDPALRGEVVGLMIDTLWSDPAARTEARTYYLGRSRGLPAQQIDNALHTIERLAHAPSSGTWGAFERGIWSDQATITPGFLAITGLEAVRACSLGGRPLEECLEQTTSLKVMSRWPAPQ
jgi:hypothetical protein